MDIGGYLNGAVVMLAASVFVVSLFRWLKLGPVLGYFVAGAVLGEHGLGVIPHNTGIEVFGEMGVVFLLFVIGIELTFDRLRSMRLHVFGLGGLQLILTSVTIAIGFYFLGHASKAAAVIAGGFAMSSTAVVLQYLEEKGKQASQLGRLALSILIMQDLAVVPMLVMIPLLAKSAGGGQFSIVYSLLLAFSKAMIAMASIWIIGRIFLRPVFRIIMSFSGNELFIATTLLIVIGAAYMTEYFGLSMALGAFMAGLMVAETVYHNEVQQVIVPFKSLLLGIFFMTVGMSIDFSLLIEKFHFIVLITFAVIIIKALIITFLAILFKFPKEKAIQAGVLMSQGSEFAFILFGLANEQSILQPELAQIMMIIVNFSMALTPLLATITNYIMSKRNPKISELQRLAKENFDLNNHVVIFGFGRVGRILANLLRDSDINFVAIDINNDIVRKFRHQGFPIYCADVDNIETLKTLALPRSVAVIVTMKNYVTVQKALRILNNHYESLNILTRIADYNDWSYYNDMIGDLDVVQDQCESALNIMGNIMDVLNYDEKTIVRAKNCYRNDNYIKITSGEKN